VNLRPIGSGESAVDAHDSSNLEGCARVLLAEVVALAGLDDEVLLLAEGEMNLVVAESVASSGAHARVR
jgi:hypothetical protein